MSIPVHLHRQTKSLRASPHTAAHVSSSLESGSEHSKPAYGQQMGPDPRRFQLQRVDSMAVQSQTRSAEALPGILDLPLFPSE